MEGVGDHLGRLFAPCGYGDFFAEYLGLPPNGIHIVVCYWNDQFCHQVQTRDFGRQSAVLGAVSEVVGVLEGPQKMRLVQCELVSAQLGLVVSERLEWPSAGVVEDLDERGARAERDQVQVVDVQGLTQPWLGGVACWGAGFGLIA